jgi:excisionase family DNA binding protein
MEKDILTIEEAAAFLKISKRSLYKLVKQGRIPGRKLLNRWRFDRDGLRRWISDEGQEIKFLGE